MLDLALGCEPNKYKPLINYRGNTLAVGSDGIRYLADSGGSPRKPALLTYGEGKLFDGNGQEVIPLISNIISGETTTYSFGTIIPNGIADILSVTAVFEKYNAKISCGIDAIILRYYNGVDWLNHTVPLAVSKYGAVFEVSTSGIKTFVNGILHDELIDTITTSTNIFSLASAGGSSFWGGILNNVSVKKGVLTTTQILFQHNFPELFVFPKKELQADGSYKWFPQSDYLNQDELDSFVALIPLNGKGAFARNMIGYSEGANIIAQPTANYSFNSGDGTCHYENNVLDVACIADGYIEVRLVSAVQPNVQGLYVFEIDVSSRVGSPILESVYVGGTSVSPYTTFNDGMQKYVVESSADYDFSYFRIQMLAGESISFYTEVKKLTNTQEIQNWAEAMDVDNIDTGAQYCFYEQDPLGVICGSNFKSIAMNGVAVPALAVPMTDTELNGAEGKWVIEFVIERKHQDGYVYLMEAYNSGNATGIRMFTDVASLGKMYLYLYDGISSKNVNAIIDENPHHIIYENDGSNLTMIIDGVAKTPVTHSFVPSNESFADSPTASPIGKLADFKIWYGDNYYKYNREKSIAKGLIAKESLL